MPELSRFYGIIIVMHFDKHHPPHFHARYGSASIAIEIKTLRVLDGHLPPRALGLTVEWAALHQQELLRAWDLAQSNQHPQKIPPLP